MSAAKIYRQPTLAEFVGFAKARGWTAPDADYRETVENLPSVPVASRNAAGRTSALQIARPEAIDVRMREAFVVGRNFSLLVDDLMVPLGYAHSPFAHSPSITLGSPELELVGPRRVRYAPKTPIRVDSSPLPRLVGIVSHFGHFFVDAIERLTVLGQRGSLRRPLLVDDNLFGARTLRGAVVPQVGDLAAKLGCGLDPASLLAVHPKSDYLLDEFEFRTPDAVKPLVSPRAIRALASVPRESVSRPTQCIFVGRSMVQNRRVLGCENLLPLLQTHGCREVLPEHLSITEAIAAFAGADRVILVIGSAKFNLAFCSPGTRVVGIVPEGYVNGGTSLMLRHLCSLLGLRLGIYECAVEGGTPGASPITADLRMDAVDVKRIFSLLDQL